MDDTRSALTEQSLLPIGRIGEQLMDAGAIKEPDLRHALRLQARIDAPLGDIMVSEGLATKETVLAALARQWHAKQVDLDLLPPEPAMAFALPAAICLRHQAVPWKREGRRLLVATSRPAEFKRLCASLGQRGQNLVPVVVDDAQIRRHQNRLYGVELAARAATRVPARESCRTWGSGAARGLSRARAALATLVVAAGLLAAAPLGIMTALFLWASLTLGMTTALKAAALWVHLSPAHGRAGGVPRASGLPFRLPKVSVLVPLLHERDIAKALISRLENLTYPKSLLDVVLVLEANDETTRATLANTRLPRWMSVIEVPQAGALTTKPRALNYALNFCQGSIIGVWDAEDWPQADQVEQIVTRFNDAPDNVACLQGILDYYNARENWMARCFTIEYASWWRIILPGIARLGLVVPLGGTTLFFRRHILEELCGWDAHNVTEDADLGVRLARHGYVTELVPTVTHEEATSRPWPWIRQRSRWLKGFMVTYLVHMKSPLALLRDLGPLRFLGVQTIFLATFSQFACAPLLWSYWLTFAGLRHPVEMSLGMGVLQSMAALFLMAEILNIVVGVIAVSGREHRHLTAFVPTLLLYFPLGAVAAYKALWELICAPFYWDKTQHGQSTTFDEDHDPVITKPRRAENDNAPPRWTA
jgi:cellulose synthase/poly-beta-1,6-N-acetylglucosamine synthase-like glycosyltransferase